MYTCTVAYTGQVTFYKALEKHGYVKSVTLYILERLGKYSLAKIKLFSFNVVLHYESLLIKNNNISKTQEQMRIGFQNPRL